MIPVENNIAGRVADMHFLLEKINLKIVAEYYSRIEHHLLAKKFIVKACSKVLSHTHALNQCKKNIKKLKISAENFIDTAGAAKYVAESNERKLSAIGSELASKIYGLKILKRNFEDSKNNVTRFLVFSKSNIKVSKKKKVITSIIFNTKICQPLFTKHLVVLHQIQ